MTRKRHTEEQIIAVLKDAQAGIGVQELCRKHDISDATFISGGPNLPASKSVMWKLRQLEDENRRLLIEVDVSIGRGPSVRILDRLF
jgi:putative transposase